MYVCMYVMHSTIYRRELLIPLAHTLDYRTAILELLLNKLLLGANLTRDSAQVHVIKMLKTISSTAQLYAYRTTIYI